MKLFRIFKWKRSEDPDYHTAYSSWLHKSDPDRPITDSPKFDDFDSNVVAFSYSRPGAMGRAGADVVTMNGEETFLPYEDPNIEKYETFFENWNGFTPPQGWGYEYLGCGNHLFIREPYYPIFKQLIQTDGEDDLYSNWVNLVLSIIEKYENRCSPVCNLQRFIDAQKDSYAAALAEIRTGCKQSHWIWYIFPQLKGLGRSYNAEYYGIVDREEAESYLAHPVLGARIREIAQALLTHGDKSAEQILGAFDALKIRSSMTLFDAVSPNDVFARVLEQFYHGTRCPITEERMDDMQLNDKSIWELNAACAYIGVEVDDFNLTYDLFLRDVSCRSIHGINHVYRTMIICTLLGELLQKPRAGLLAFCGAYIHDLAYIHDGIDLKHGQRAVDLFFHRFDSLWDKYDLTDKEREWIMAAVAQHSTCEWMQPSDEGYDVMAILKDADALDRCRFWKRGLNPAFLRLKESHLLVEQAKQYFASTEYNNKPVSFREFIRLCHSGTK